MFPEVELREISDNELTAKGSNADVLFKIIPESDITSIPADEDVLTSTLM